MSSTHCRLYRRGSHWLLEDAGSKNGTFVVGDAIRELRLSSDTLFEAGRTLFMFLTEAPCDRDGELDIDLDRPNSPGRTKTLATLSPLLKREYDRLIRIAPTALPVVITGETGTGKEVAARALHELSRRSGPFVGVNCGALKESLIESELFGHKKGAFSGADRDRPGLFRSADRGTIFLDEIAELPPSSQVALLRVLQEGEVRPVGGTAVVPVDVRVVAATLRDLPARVAAGAFRQDLYARLCGLVVELPALRDRREDIGLLCGLLLRKLARTGKAQVHLDSARIDRRAAQALFSYDWPLNVRELEHSLAAAVALADGDTLQFENLPAIVRAAFDKLARSSPPPPDSTRDQALHRQLIELLRSHRGNVSAVARAMGKERVQVYRWLERLNIDARDYRG